MVVKLICALKWNEPFFYSVLSVSGVCFNVKLCFLTKHFPYGKRYFDIDIKREIVKCFKVLITRTCNVFAIKNGDYMASNC